MSKEIIKTDRPAPLNNPSERAYHKVLPTPAEEITPVDFDTCPVFVGMYEGKKDLITKLGFDTIPASGETPETPGQPDEVEPFHIFIFNGKKFAVRSDEPMFATVNEAMERVKPGGILIEIEYLGNIDENTKRGRFEVSEHK